MTDWRWVSRLLVEVWLGSDMGSQTHKKWVFHIGKKSSFCELGKNGGKGRECKSYLTLQGTGIPRPITATHVNARLLGRLARLLPPCPAPWPPYPAPRPPPSQPPPLSASHDQRSPVMKFSPAPPFSRHCPTPRRPPQPGLARREFGGARPTNPWHSTRHLQNKYELDNNS